MRFVAVVAVVAAGSLTASAAGAEQYPVPYTFTANVIAGATQQGNPPPGANNWSCKPSAAHPRPVVLVHGLLANMTDNWQTMSPLLANNGYCVFALTYGTNASSTPGSDQFGGLTTMEDSAAQLRTFVNQVLQATGAKKVDLVGTRKARRCPTTTSSTSAARRRSRTMSASRA